MDVHEVKRQVIVELTQGCRLLPVVELECHLFSLDAYDGNDLQMVVRRDKAWKPSGRDAHYYVVASPRFENVATGWHPQEFIVDRDALPEDRLYAVSLVGEWHMLHSATRGAPTLIGSFPQYS